jgi:hypothetical protein
MEAKDDRDLIGTIGRCVNTLRDALLTALIIFGAFVLWDLWPQIEQQLKTSRVEEFSLGAITVKLNTETVASFGSNNLTINAVGGSADILEKGGLEDLQAQISKGGAASICLAYPAAINTRVIFCLRIFRGSHLSLSCFEMATCWTRGSMPVSLRRR